MMSAKAETYRAIAEGCRRKAVRAIRPEDKTEWLGLAESWLQLLKDVEYAGDASPEKATDWPASSDRDTRARH